MKNGTRISVNSDRNDIDINIRTILYVIMKGNMAYIHLADGNIIETRVTLQEFETMLGDDFIKVKRNCLVSAYAIHEIDEDVILVNGEHVVYAKRNYDTIIKEYHAKQKRIINSFSKYDIPTSIEEFHNIYRIFDDLPIAFTDIEMIFDEQEKVTDWRFCYGNEALAKLEKTPLDKLVGHSFTEVFPTMSDTWLKLYERSTLFEELLNIVDYSPEIDANLQIICFPTFKGHCGVILLNVDDLKFYHEIDNTDRAIGAFISKLFN